MGNFEVCVSTRVALCMFIMQVLASQLHFLAKRNIGQAISPLFWPVNCIKVGGHVALLSGPTVLSLYCTINYITALLTAQERASEKIVVCILNHFFGIRFHF